MKNLNKIIREISEEENIKYSTASKDWVITLEKDNKRRFIIGCKFDINSYGAGSVCDDKYATADFLTIMKVPAVEEKIFYSPDNKSEFAKYCNSNQAVLDYFYKNKKDVVIKQNQGTGGEDIYHITDEAALLSTYNELLKKYYSISIGPFYEIENEYRAIMLDSVPKLIYKKIKPVVVGNGNNTIKELLVQFNPKYFEKIDINGDRILNRGEIFEYNWKFNLCGGAKASLEINDEIRRKVEELAITATKTLNMRFCSVDVIKTTDNQFLILEVNTGVMMEGFIEENDNGHDIAKEIYKSAIEKMFN